MVLHLATTDQHERFTREAVTWLERPDLCRHSDI